MVSKGDPAGKAGTEQYDPSSGRTGTRPEPGKKTQTTGAYCPPQVHSYSSKQLLAVLGTAQG